MTESNVKIDTEVAGLKTMLESHKLDSIKYLAGNGSELFMFTLTACSSNNVNDRGNKSKASRVSTFPSDMVRHFSEKTPYDYNYTNLHLAPTAS